MIEKAGGIITRTSEHGEREIYVIHRPRYNDWSLPKGHIDLGETTAEAALREVEEETGFRCSVVRALPNYIYQLPNDEQVVVHFFELSVVTNTGKTDDEADRGEWMNILDACERISYPSQQTYLLTTFAK